MSAPGDIVILIVLLAAFLACVGYAAGRVHQRRQHAPERDQAYQEGYDSATRTVFGMAARAAGRRRGRGSVHGAAAVPPKEEPTVPVQPAPAVTKPAEAKPTVTKPAEVEPAQLRTTPPEPAPQQLGFPAPVPHTGPGLPPPAAPGGVTYTALPDPRSAGDPEPPPAGEERRGRHLVPDELVRAATYRLPPDRVARAKVREPQETGEPTVPYDPPVPRPRGTS